MDDDGAGGAVSDQSQDGLQVGGPLRGGSRSTGWPSARGRRRRTGGRWPTSVRAAILALRRAHPHWGPKKLRAILPEREPRRAWPAASTMGDLLRREGLSQPRRRTRYVVPLTQPLAAAQAPNDVWTADFKGWFRTADGTRCDPLTVADACSRFVLCCRIVRAERARACGPWFERTFREYGLAAGAADRQRVAVRDDRRRAPVASGGLVVEAGHSAGSD